MLRLSSLLFILLTLVATFVGFSIAASDDAAKLLSLEVLKPMADRMVAAGEIFALHGAENLQAVLFAMLAVVIVTGFRFCRPRRNFFVLGIALALVAQVSLISTELAFRLSNQVIQSVPDMTGVTLVYAIGAALYAASLLCLVIAFWRDDPMAAVVERSKADKGFSIRDALILLLSRWLRSSSGCTRSTRSSITSRASSPASRLAERPSPGSSWRTRVLRERGRRLGFCTTSQSTLRRSFSARPWRRCACRLRLSAC